MDELRQKGKEIQFRQYASKLIENERHQHAKSNSNPNHKASSSSSPECLENSDQINKEQLYHSSRLGFSTSQNIYPYAHELMKSYHHKMLGNAKKEEDQEEELNVDRDADVNMIGIYQKGESQNETSNIPEDLSKKGSKSNESSEDSNRYHPYKQNKSIRAQSPNIIGLTPNDQNNRQSPIDNVSMI